MAVQIRDLSNDWRPGDAERLARLMNDASAGWPEGAWDPQTPEQAARNVRERRYLGTFVAVEGDLFISHRIATRSGHPIDKVFAARRSGAPWGTIAEEAGVQPDLLVADVATAWPEAANAVPSTQTGGSEPSKAPPAQAGEPPKSPAAANPPFQPFGDSRTGDRAADEIRNRMIRGGGIRQ